MSPVRIWPLIDIPSEAWQRVQTASTQVSAGTRKERQVILGAPECHGKPVVRDLRYPVQMLLEFLASGLSIEEVLADYPDLERDHLLAALEFAALQRGGQVAGPLVAA